MFKLLHCADIHLDSPFRSKTAEQSETARRELKNAFLSLIKTVKDEGISLVLMAGDVFDTPSVSADTLAFFKEAVASVPETVFVISPGNHDPYSKTGVYSGEFPPNVRIFKEAELSYVDIEGTNIRVYGYAFCDTNILESCPFVGNKPEDDSKINLLCGHAEIGDPLSPYCPVSLRDIEESGFDYCAFGHIHLSEGVKRVGQVPYAYSGCLCGRDFGETGPKGAIVVTLDGSKASGLKKSYEQRSFSRYDYEERSLDISGAFDGFEMRARLGALLSETKYETFLRVSLSGHVPPDLKIDLRSLEDELSERVFYLEIRDETLPLYGTERLKSDPTILGEFFRELLPMLEGGTPEERRLAAKALRAGIAALRGEELPE